MTHPPLAELKQQASLALRTGDFETALAIYGELERAQPDQAIWPERQALALAELGRRSDQIDALLRAVGLHIDVGDVIKAISACKEILDIDPDNASTLDRLQLLYIAPGSSGDPTASDESTDELEDDLFEANVSVDRPLAPPEDLDAPLDEVLLTHVIPGALPLALDNETLEGIHEIPIDCDSTGTLNLHLSGNFPRTSPGMGIEARCAEGVPIAREDLADTPLFSSLKPRILNQLIQKARIVHLNDGELLFQQGDPAKSLYMVIEGAVVPIAEGRHRTHLSVLEEGDFFGEIGIVTNRPRTASIEAIVETRLLEIDRALIRNLIRRYPDVLKVLLRFFRDRLIDTQIQTNPFFTAFARADRKAVARQFRFLEIQQDATLITQHQPSPGLFVVLTGELEIFDEENDKDLDVLTGGDLVGAMSLVERAPARASAIATQKSWVLMMAEARFRKIAELNPGLEDLIVEIVRARESECSGDSSESAPTGSALI